MVNDVFGHILCAGLGFAICSSVAAQATSQSRNVSTASVLVSTIAVRDDQGNGIPSEIMVRKGEAEPEGFSQTNENGDAEPNRACFADQRLLAKPGVPIYDVKPETCKKDVVFLVRPKYVTKKLLSQVDRVIIDLRVKANFEDSFRGYQTLAEAASMMQRGQGVTEAEMGELQWREAILLGFMAQTLPPRVVLASDGVFYVGIGREDPANPIAISEFQIKRQVQANTTSRGTAVNVYPVFSETQVLTMRRAALMNAYVPDAEDEVMPNTLPGASNEDEPPSMSDVKQ